MLKSNLGATTLHCPMLANGQVVSSEPLWGITGVTLVDDPRCLTPIRQAVEDKGLNFSYIEASCVDFDIARFRLNLAPIIHVPDFTPEKHVFIVDASMSGGRCVFTIEDFSPQWQVRQIIIDEIGAHFRSVTGVQCTLDILEIIRRINPSVDA